MIRFLKSALMLSLLGCVVALVGCSSKDTPKPDNSKPAPAAKKHFKVGVSIYAGWMPWYHNNGNGTLKAWADSQNIEIEVVPFADYPSSLDAYSAGKIDAVVATNMDSL